MSGEKSGKRSKPKLKPIEAFEKAFGQLLGEVGKERVSKNDVPKNCRRLDSIARLLEGGSICTAVYFHEKTKRLWVACNKIQHNSRDDNAEIKKLKNILNFITDQSCDMSEMIETMSEVVEQSFRQEMRFSINQFKKIDLNEKIQKLFSQMLLSGETTKKWRDREIGELDDESPDYKAELFIIKQVSRYVRDLLKVKKYLTISKNETALSNQISEAIKNRDIDILHIESKNVHAEMRLLAKKIGLKEENDPTAYFGISKLCCNHCALVLNQFDIDNRGLHGRPFDWPVPNFISKKNEHLKKVLGDSTFSIWDKLDKIEKSQSFKIISSKKTSPVKDKKRPMTADSSESDTSFGFENTSESQEENIRAMTLSEVKILAVIKQSYYDEYTRLRRFGMELIEIKNLFENKSQFEKLSNQKIFEFIVEMAEKYEESECVIFESLKDLLTENKKTFKLVVNADEALKEHFSVSELIDRLSPHYTSANSEGEEEKNWVESDNISVDPYAPLEEEMRGETGWDYSCHSSNSENYYGSHRSTSSHGCREMFFNHSQSDNSDQEIDASSRSESEQDFDSSFSHSSRA